MRRLWLLAVCVWGMLALVGCSDSDEFADLPPARDAEGNLIFPDGDKQDEGLTKLAKEGDVGAQFRLGYLYERQCGGRDLALYWYARAAEQGHQEAQKCYEALENDWATTQGTKYCLNMMRIEPTEMACFGMWFFSLIFFPFLPVTIVWVGIGTLLA